MVSIIVSFAPGQYARIRKPHALKGQPKFGEPLEIMKRIGKASYKMEDGTICYRNRMAATNVDSEVEPMEIEEKEESRIDAVNVVRIPATEKPKTPARRPPTWKPRQRLATSSRLRQVSKWRCHPILTETMERHKPS